MSNDTIAMLGIMWITSILPLPFVVKMFFIVKNEVKEFPEDKWKIILLGGLVILGLSSPMLVTGAITLLEAGVL